MNNIERWLHLAAYEGYQSAAHNAWLLQGDQNYSDEYEALTRAHYDYLYEYISLDEFLATMDEVYDSVSFHYNG